ncbi:Hypothetical protein, predicted transmembrane protein [Metamycoplasma auris 15026]|uniref:Uncharacterized protein n=1 Tax=Metamycoplasma auris 15026 TaxID=1188233 RepID=N9VB98_9BACT|nr:hypothetical protein [Metamycoplasma auris]ENY68661.1 Hypothetical protein, predicted transmembrane protein [Metamycoplasma auris 15026]
MGNDTGKIIVYTLFSLILVFIVFYIVWKATKTKRTKKKMEKLEQKKAAETLELYYEFILTYNQIIDFTNNELDKFYNNNTDKKMGQILKGAKKLLLKLISRDDFAFYFHENKKYEDFVKNAELITTIQANLWPKKIPNVIAFFKDEFSAIENKENKEKFIELTNISINNQFYGN